MGAIVLGTAQHRPHRAPHPHLRAVVPLPPVRRASFTIASAGARAGATVASFSRFLPSPPPRRFRAARRQLASSSRFAAYFSSRPSYSSADRYPPRAPPSSRSSTSSSAPSIDYTVHSSSSRCTPAWIKGQSTAAAPHDLAFTEHATRFGRRRGVKNMFRRRLVLRAATAIRWASRSSTSTTSRPSTTRTVTRPATPCWPRPPAWRETLRARTSSHATAARSSPVLLPDCPPARCRRPVERLRPPRRGADGLGGRRACWDRAGGRRGARARADAALYEAKEAGRDRALAAAA